MDLMNIYNKLPIFAQNIACSIEGYKINKLRFNKEFWSYLGQYENRLDMTDKDLTDYRDRRLQKIILHAYNNVPYYTRTFDELGISPMDIKNLDDLKVLPILNKKILRENHEDFIARNIPRKDMLLQTTSGSTGTSLHIMSTKQSINEQWAVWWRYRRALGINFNDWCAYFASRPVVPSNQSKPPFWRVNYPGKQLHFSGFHGTEENYFEYFKKLKSSGIKWIHGYPSSITPFASFMIENDLTLGNQIQFVTTGGENIYEYQRSIILKAFGVPAYSHYGLTEGAANFSENQEGELIIDEDFAAVEFLRNNDGTHNIIGTNLTNYAMPLIRWNTDDLATVDSSFDDFNIRRTIEFVDGRNAEYIILPNGTKIGTLSALFTETKTFVEAQLYQKSNYDLIIRVVKTVGDSSDDELKVRKLLKERIGDSINIEFSYLNKIPRSKNGKLRYVISEVKQ